MPNENLNMQEQFSAAVIKATPTVEVKPLIAANRTIEVKPRHFVIGYGLIAAVIVAIALWFVTPSQNHAPTLMQEKPGLIESLGTKIGGYLTIQQIRAGSVLHTWGPIENNIPNVGETALRDCFINTSCTPVQNFKFHGLGTSATAVAETDTGCTTELTTQYATDNVRPTGSQTNNGANVYRTVGTNTVDQAVTIQEFCLMSQAATGGGTDWTHILTGGIALNAGDALVTTYDLTIE
jgi:hypothetical protein